MAQSKIEFRLGDLHFTSEGEKVWVTKQLDKIISKVPSLLKLSGNNSDDLLEQSQVIKNSNGSSKTRKKTNAPKALAAESRSNSDELPTFIRQRKVGSNQRIKFLATAMWVAKQGKPTIVTRDISKALKEARLPKLANPSVNLSQNVKQGYLKKSGKGFVLSSKGKHLLNSN